MSRYKQYGRAVQTATLEFTEEENDEGFSQDCVYAICDKSGDSAGPIWGCGEASAKRALATLTEECSCGADFHKSANGDE